VTAVPLAPAPPAARRLPAEVVRQLAQQRSPADRLRARATTAAAAGIGVVLLLAVTISGIPDAADPDSYQPHAAQPGLAPFLAQSGLRPGSVVAALLLVLPFAALTVQALRVGSLALQRQAGLLALAGATPADLRRVRVARTRAAFLRGGLLAAPAYAVLWLLLGVALPSGTRLLPSPQWWLPLAWVGVLALLVATGRLLGLRTPRAGQDDDGTVSAALSRQDLVAGGPPQLRWAVASGGAAVLVAVGGSRVVGGTPLPAFLALLCLVVLLAGVCAALLVARSAAGSPPARRRQRVRAARRAGRGDAAVAVLAGAQRRANPVAAGTVGGVLFVCGLSFGVEASLSAGLLTPADDYLPSDLAFYLGGAALAAAVAVVGICVALLALGLALSDHLLATRRSVAATAALGLEPRRLLAVQRRSLTGSAVPAVVAGTLVSGLLYSAGVSSRYLLLPWVPYVVVVVAAAAAGLLVALACRLVVALLAGRVRAASALEHLRTP
jgi:hypothetical protein